MLIIIEDQEENILCEFVINYKEELAPMILAVKSCFIKESNFTRIQLKEKTTK
jgi:hypothetical protein